MHPTTKCAKRIFLKILQINQISFLSFFRYEVTEGGYEDSKGYAENVQQSRSKNRKVLVPSNTL